MLDYVISLLFRFLIKITQIKNEFLHDNYQWILLLYKWDGITCRTCAESRRSSTFSGYM
jgi:hypothetical protein